VKWTVASGQNAGVFGRCYPVVREDRLDPTDTQRYKFLPGCHETILCSSSDTAHQIADWLNSRIKESP